MKKRAPLAKSARLHPLPPLAPLFHSYSCITAELHTSFFCFATLRHSLPFLLLCSGNYVCIYIYTPFFAQGAPVRYWNIESTLEVHAVAGIAAPPCFSEIAGVINPD